MWANGTLPAKDRVSLSPLRSVRHADRAPDGVSAIDGMITLSRMDCCWAALTKYTQGLAMASSGPINDFPQAQSVRRAINGGVLMIEHVWTPRRLIIGRSQLTLGTS